MDRLLNEIYEADNRNKKNLKNHLIFDEMKLALKDFKFDLTIVPPQLLQDSSKKQ